MPALVSDDPESSGKQTSPKTVQRPNSESCRGVEIRAGKVKVCRVDVGVKELCSFVRSNDHKQVPETRA